MPEAERRTESQFVYLMQILLHRGAQGVSRDELLRVLFEEREISNMAHALQSVLYNAKQKLRRAGLPDVCYIIRDDDTFYWTPQIPVEEDAARFEALFHQAESASHLEEQTRLYLNACYCYTGEFLPNMAGVLWAAQEAKRYQELFAACVERTATLLRMQQNYHQLEELGRFAARTQPLCNWELLTMEALTAADRYEDARQLYDETVELYMQQQGLRPSKRLMEMLSRLGNEMQHSYEALDTIQHQLSGGKGSRGGYLCTYPVFQGIYRMAERLLERGGQSIYLMLCTVVDGKGNPMREGHALEELSQRMEEAICCSVRHSDVVTRYGRGQYLVLLINTTLENCTVIQKRINYHFIQGRQRSEIQYYVNSVVSPYLSRS